LSNTELPDDWRRVVIESQAIAGIYPYVEDSLLTENHMKAANVLAKAKRWVDVRLINGVLTGRSGDWLRGGIEADNQGKVPDGIFVQDVLDAWTEEALAIIENAKRWTPEELAARIRAVHQKLICIHPFKEANFRTAHMVLNHMRTLVGLPVLVVERRDSKAYFRQHRKYAREVFLPWMRAEIKAIKLRCAQAKRAEEKVKKKART
jgi:prophage maintenance system killer protein